MTDGQLRCEIIDTLWSIHGLTHMQPDQAAISRAADRIMDAFARFERGAPPIPPTTTVTVVINGTRVCVTAPSS